MFSRIISGMAVGIEGYKIGVEVDVSNGLPLFEIVGYVTSDLKEAKERVKTSIRNCGYALPPKHITVNVSPADLRKDGPSFDLPIAIGILCSTGYVSEYSLRDVLIIGELSLDGNVNRVAGILPIVDMAREQGIRKCIVPLENALEGAVIEGIDVIGVSTLKQVVDYLNNEESLEAEYVDMERYLSENMKYEEDFVDVIGQVFVKRAAIIATCGMHNMLLIGPPGAGKTMIARRLTTIMPPLTVSEAVEITKIYSVAGMLNEEQSLICKRPFRDPNYTISRSALAGGGVRPMPGEISLSNRGILFLDELPEYNRNTLEILRQPLEEGVITVNRVSGSYTFPAKCMLVAAMNPCRCGYYPDESRCTCTKSQINRYLGKISGPLLDRIDICVEVPKISKEELSRLKRGKKSLEIRSEVMRTVAIQQDRYKELGICFNSELTGKYIQEFCRIDKEKESFLGRVFEKQGISMRAYNKILKVARTIADYEGESEIEEEHLMEAVCYRTLDKKYWNN